SLPDASQITSGTFKPTKVTGGDTFSSPARSGPYGTVLSAFNGVNPNGTWSLYVVDDATQDIGSIGGWRLNFTVSGSVCCSGAVNQPPVVNSASIVPGPNAFSDEALTVTSLVTTDAESEVVSVAYQWQFTTDGTS